MSIMTITVSCLTINPVWPHSHTISY